MRRALWVAWVAAVLVVGVACEQPSSQKAKSAFLVRPEKIDFGPSALGRTKTFKLKVANGGRASYRVEGAVSSVPNVVIPPFEPFTLSAGAEQELEIHFTPQVEGVVQGQVEILTDSGEPGEVPVNGRGVKAFVEVPDTALDFGNVAMGMVEMREVTVRNPSDVESPLGLSIHGADADQFTAGLGQSSTLAPGETRVVPVAYGPRRLGSAEAALHVVVCEGCEPAVIPMRGMGVASKLEVTPLRVDFGRVALGATAEQSITVRNQGTEPLSYSGVQLLDNPGGVFKVVNAPVLASGVLAAGAAVELRVAFTPVALGRVRDGRVEIGVREQGSSAPGPKVSLTGEGGASCITVLPRKLDYGVVAEGMTATRQVQVINRCREDVLVNHLQLDTLAGGYFTLAQAPASITVPSGGTAEVGVTFSPRSGLTAPSLGQLAVTVRTTASTSTEAVALTGEGRVFKPCDYAPLLPARFGKVPVGAEVGLGVSIRNTGPEACYLASMQLAAGSDAAFTAEPVENRVLEPGQKATLVVRFKPPAEGSFSGLAEAWVNHPTAGHPLVPVTGEGVKGCFAVQPTTVDFGITKLSCGPRTRELIAVNDCIGPVHVQGLALEQVGGEFSVTSPTGFPHTIPQGGRVRLSATYTPVDDGDDAAALRFTLANGGGEYTAGLVGRGVTKAEQTDRFFQESEAKVDVLFVVDNSGSMMEEQQSLGQNFAAFLTAANKASVDYRIGVTTTGLDPSPGGWSECPGGAQGGENGRLFPVDGSRPRIITPSTPNAAGVFANNTRVGVCHWNEQGLDAAHRALSDPLLYQQDDPRTPLAGDGNGGFLREEAKLAIIFLSDEEDFSSQPVSFYETYFLALKGNDKSKLSINAIVGPADLSTCPTSSSSGNRYIQLAQATGGAVESICTPNWAASLEKLSNSAFGLNRKFPLSEQPADPARIVVDVNGARVPSGWHYDAGTNAIIFDRDAAPQAGAMVEVTYPLGCN
ncbi:choice-of-anchor D domain-containing protein [Myxococcus sp. RHSTA-1-4]|uniref:choice-of-anchor D domain-containing protein n=1 Tax=Myxococcus sp. RHSTA-1-4 TaxID=2874601 RepID=UPI001CBE25FD|nr:choice-of-anchor D domain-containing protein [Myxococcus sp. RHSTA-1-4]MBZ4417001.1 choice-of-anchor D domain-containing protein [Myxococcus sp. RHSTA-1-4]